MTKDSRSAASGEPEGWKRELQSIIDRFNPLHARYPKGVSHKTQEDRAYFLFYAFRLLRIRPGKFKKLRPRNIGERHITYLVEYWVREGKAPGTLQAYLSILRTFCNWLDKPGMVKKAEAYVSDPAFVARCYTAAQDKAWTAHGILPEEKIAEVKAFDLRVGVQLLLQHHFALRVKEAIMLRPRLAEVDGHVMLTSYTHTYKDVQAYVALTAMAIKRGTKGGRLRHVPIDTPGKRAALEEAKQLAEHEAAHLGSADKSLAQNLRRFYYVMERCGITQAQLGITAHGQRHQYAGDLYEKVSGTPAPVRAGDRVDRQIDRAGRLLVAQHLGHAREGITGAYLGGIRRRAPETPAVEVRAPAEPAQQATDPCAAAKQGRAS